MPLSTLGRLTDVQQFENIVVRATEDGRVLRIKDVARVELGALTETLNCQVNGKPSVSMAIFQLPDANALDTAVLVKDKIAELAREFPPGVGWEIRYDTTPYITESIDEVFKTLREAIILVAVVVLLFLQSWRSSIIPLIAVPVAIVGTFAAMAALGFSLNNLTLFGLVLAIGIVVDDAIVVVEAVEHHIDHGMTPRDATIRAMEEVSGPVIAIGLVLTAVFVPCAFISGIVGQFFRQFALDDRRQHDHLGVQLADALARAGRPAAQASDVELEPRRCVAEGGVCGGRGVSGLSAHSSHDDAARSLARCGVGGIRGDRWLPPSRRGVAQRVVRDCGRPLDRDRRRRVGGTGPGLAGGTDP